MVATPDPQHRMISQFMGKERLYQFRMGQGKTYAGQNLCWAQADFIQNYFLQKHICSTSKISANKYNMECIKMIFLKKIPMKYINECISRMYLLSRLINYITTYWEFFRLLRSSAALWGMM